MSESWAEKVTKGSILGYACPNPQCDQREMLIVLPSITCRLCGTAMKKAKVVCLSFEWEKPSPKECSRDCPEFIGLYEEYVCVRDMKKVNKGDRCRHEIEDKRQDKTGS